MPTLLNDHIAGLGELTAIRDDHGPRTRREQGERVDRRIRLSAACGSHLVMDIPVRELREPTGKIREDLLQALLPTPQESR
jgi:hypothetical protein